MPYPAAGGLAVVNDDVSITLLGIIIDGWLNGAINWGCCDGVVIVGTPRGTFWLVSPEKLNCVPLGCSYDDVMD